MTHWYLAVDRLPAERVAVRFDFPGVRGTGSSLWISFVGTMRSALGTESMGGRGGDDIQLGASGDSVYGRGGGDLIVTDGGGDCIAGGAAFDLIRYGAADDEIVGARGKDSIYGGAGNDTIWVQDGASDFVQCGPGYDTVASWNPGDKLASDCEVRA
jgi:Ca2+-binding RTX toxin-like protein